jgi:hypothetical protein
LWNFAEILCGEIWRSRSSRIEAIAAAFLIPTVSERPAIAGESLLLQSILHAGSY